MILERRKGHPIRTHDQSCKPTLLICDETCAFKWENIPHTTRTRETNVWMCVCVCTRGCECVHVCVRICVSGCAATLTGPAAWCMTCQRETNVYVNKRLPGVGERRFSGITTLEVFIMELKVISELQMIPIKPRHSEQVKGKP